MEIRAAMRIALLSDPETRDNIHVADILRNLNMLTRQ